MSTTADVQDPERLEEAMVNCRDDGAGLNRKSWVILGHVENNPNMVDVLAVDNSEEASLEGFTEKLESDQVMYCLVRLTTTVDMSTTVKFVYVHWIGEEVPFAKRGRYGVVHGSVEQHFRPNHLMVETGNLDDLTESELVTRLDESSGTKSNVVEGSSDGLQHRGFTAHQTKHSNRREPKSVAPAGEAVEVAPELNEAIGEVRQDTSEVNWVLAGFEEGNLKKPLTLIEKGTGDIDSVTKHLEDDQVMYVLYRTKDIIDDIETVKFVYVFWIGPDTKPLTKGKVSAFAGPVERVFSPAHVTLSFTNRYDIEEDIINDKVMSSSGSKSHVK